MPVISRQAEPGDLPELLRLEAESFSGDHLSRRSLRRLLRVPTALCLVVEDGGAGEGKKGRLAGYALWLYRRNSTQARLYSIAVDDRSRGKGVGSHLLAAGTRLAIQRGCTRMSLEVRADNTSALHLYCKLGFAEVGRQEGYYEDGSEALQLVKSLS